MNKNNNRDRQTEDLLKKVLADDLPSKTETRMRESLVEFMQNYAAAGRSSIRQFPNIWDRFLRLQAGKWLDWLPRKEILAFSSLVMIFIGGFLHISGQRSALADTFSLLNGAVSVSEHLIQAQHMECTVREQGESGGKVVYHIRWMAPGTSRVDVRRNGAISKTLWISDTEIVVKDNIEGTSEKVESLDQIERSDFDPVMEFLSPTRLSQDIYSKWKPRRHSRLRQDQENTESFMFEGDGSQAVWEMMVDRKTSLPLKITKAVPDPASPDLREKTTMEIVFSWNMPISLQLLAPTSQSKFTEIGKENQYED